MPVQIRKVVDRYPATTKSAQQAWTSSAVNSSSTALHIAPISPGSGSCMFWWMRPSM
jgi:hypothetical protein